MLIKTLFMYIYIALKFKVSILDTFSQYCLYHYWKFDNKLLEKYLNFNKLSKEKMKSGLLFHTNCAQSSKLDLKL